MDNQGYNTIIPKQGGREKQPDLIAQKGEKDIAIEVETSANHPEQIIKNYKKNTKIGRFVIFIVPDEEVKRIIRNILKDIGKRYKIYKLKNYQD